MDKQAIDAVAAVASSASFPGDRVGRLEQQAIAGAKEVADALPGIATLRTVAQQKQALRHNRGLRQLRNALLQLRSYGVNPIDREFWLTLQPTT